jgi:hypothetical protein
METQTSYEKYITFCINILEPQLLHHLVRNPLLAHSSFEGQPVNQSTTACCSTSTGLCLPLPISLTSSFLATRAGTRIQLTSPVFKLHGKQPINLMIF